MFHAQHMSASLSPVEKCRRHQYFAVMAAAVTSAAYFSMVLFDELRRSVVALGIVQAAMGPCGLFATRLWIYT